MSATDVSTHYRSGLNRFAFTDVGNDRNGAATTRQAVVPSFPRWDGTRVLFEITEGNEQILCAISHGALEAIAERRCFPKAPDLLGCFSNARGRIERLALEKLKSRPGGVSGRLSLWVDDVDLLPPDGTPLESHQKYVRQRGA